jgi:hypothetical protein
MLTTIILWSEFLSVCLEELRWLHRVAPCNVVEGHGGDVVCLAFTDEGVVFEEIVLLRVVAAGLGVEDFLGFGSKEG